MHNKHQRKTRITALLIICSLFKVMCFTFYIFLFKTHEIKSPWEDYTLITNLMHWLLFIHKILFSSTCFEHQVLILSLKTPTNNLSPPVSSHSSCVSTGHQDSYREWRYHMLLVYNYVLLKMSTWYSKHVEENGILWINNNQCIKLVINV